MKPTKMCLRPTSVPGHQAGTSDQNIGSSNSCVFEYTLHIGSGRGSVKIQIPIDDWVSNFFKICKLMIYCVFTSDSFITAIIPFFMVHLIIKLKETPGKSSYRMSGLNPTLIMHSINV